MTTTEMLARIHDNARRLVRETVPPKRPNYQMAELLLKCIEDDARIALAVALHVRAPKSLVDALAALLGEIRTATRAGIWAEARDIHLWASDALAAHLKHEALAQRAAA